MTAADDRSVRSATFIVAIVVIVGMYAHMFFGVDYRDEAYHVSQPYRFVLGDRAFVDELDFHLGFGLVTAPLYRPHVVLFGTEGIVLFGRHGYWIFTLGLAFLSWRCLRGFVSSVVAVGASLVCVGFTAAIPSLSYDNLGIGFFTAGVLCAARSATDPRRQWWPLVAGLCHGFAVTAYFPMAAALGVVTAVLLAVTPEFRLRTVALYALGIVAAATPLIMAVWQSGPAAVLLSYRETMPLFGDKPFGTPKIVGLLWDLGSCLKRTWWLPAILLVTAVSVRRGWHATILACLASYPVAILVLPMHGFGAGAGFDSAVLGFTLHYGAAGLVLAVCLWCEPSLQRPMLIIISSAAASAATMGYTSAGAYTRVGVGLLPAAILGVALAGTLALKSIARFAPTACRAFWAIVLVVIVCGPAVIETTLQMQWVLTATEGRYAWRRVWDLTARLPNGPFKGLYGDTATRRTLMALADDLSGIPRSPQARGLTVGNFSAGYLFLQRLPAARMVVATWKRDIDMLETTGVRPDVILVWGRFDPASGGDEQLFDRALEFVAAHKYEKVPTTDPGYELYRLRATAIISDRTM